MRKKTEYCKCNYPGYTKWKWFAKVSLSTDLISSPHNYAYTICPDCNFLKIYFKNPKVYGIRQARKKSEQKIEVEYHDFYFF